MDDSIVVLSTFFILFMIFDMNFVFLPEIWPFIWVSALWKLSPYCVLCMAALFAD